MASRHGVSPDPPRLTAHQWEIVRRLAVALDVHGLAGEGDLRTLRALRLVEGTKAAPVLTDHGHAVWRAGSEAQHSRTAPPVSLLVDDARSLLLIVVAGEISPRLFAEVEREVRRFRDRFGLADVILDLTGILGTLEPDYIKARGSVTGTMAGRRRVFVVSDAHHYGLVRLYRGHKEAIGETTPAITRTVPQALALIGRPDAAFGRLVLA